MALKKRDFQKIAQHIQEFLSKLICDEDTADLRDTLNLTLLYMQRYYKTLRSRSHSNTISPRSTDHRSLSGTLLFTNSSGAISPVSPACGVPNQFEWKWCNLESPKLSASLGTSEFSSLSPFLHAAKTGDIEVLKELVDKDQSVMSSVDGLGRNAVMYAVHGNTEKHTECLEMMIGQPLCELDHQANDESTALHVAAHQNNSSALRILLKNKASCNLVDNEGRTALHWAAANPSVENLKLLLQHGASITANDCEGLTPSMWACHFEQLQNLLLLNAALARADPREEALYEETDLKGRTVVHWAVNKTGSIECLRELLTGSSALLCDREKKNILHTAAEQGVMQACQLVLDVCGNGCLSMTDSKGRTPLHLASLCGHAEIINFLLEQGANLSAPDNNGQTPVDYIKQKRLYYCMMILGLNPQFQSLCSNDKDVNLATTVKEMGHHLKMPPSVLSESKDYSENIILEPLSQTSSSRRKSEPTAPKPRPRQNRKTSEPTSPRNKEENIQEQINIPKESITENDQNNDSSHSYEKEKVAPVRRQSLLMRQGGFQEDLTQGDSGTTFDMGNELVILTDIDDLQTNVCDLDDDLEIDCGINQDDQENFEFSGCQLAEEQGSPTSVHSEPDHACSVSVEMSVSSLGSDNDEMHHNDNQVNDNTQTNLLQQQQTVQQSSGKIPFAPHPPQSQHHPLQGQAHSLNAQPHSSETCSNPSPLHSLSSQVHSHSSQMHSHSSQMHSHPSQMHSHPSQMHSHPSQMHSHSSQMQSHPSQVHSHSSQSQHSYSSQLTEKADELTLEKEGKKKKKNKNKKKLSSDTEPTYPMGSLRGVIAPLEPPDILGSSKARTTEMMAPKPGPWEHSSLGILRRGSPESPRAGPHNQYQAPDELLEVDALHGQGNRPWTPEPPPSPRNGKHHLSHPGRDEVMYSPAGSGPLAHSQDLLRNTDMIRGPQPGKLDAVRTSMGTSLSRSKNPQHSFSLHGPLPHPPQK